jgi:hypothetical protein
VGGRSPCTLYLRRNTGGIAVKGEPSLLITINTLEDGEKRANLTITRANDGTDEGCGGEIRDSIFDTGEQSTVNQIPTGRSNPL